MNFMCGNRTISLCIISLSSQSLLFYHKYNIMFKDQDILTTTDHSKNLKIGFFYQVHHFYESIN